MTHDELRDLIPIYALDALEGVEELEIRSDLEACQACPLATAVPLTGTGSGVNASAELYVSGDKHTAGLVARGLSDPGKNVYQLWLIGNNNVPVPVQAFRPDSSGLALVQIRTNLSN